MSVQAVLLAGGQGRRLGGEDKALLLREGRPLLLHWREALEQQRIPCAVVGPDHLRQTLGPEIPLTREEPAWGGPAAAVRAGALALGGHHMWTLLLAVDVVAPPPLLEWLLRELEELNQSSGPEEPKALIPRDSAGRLQYLGSAVAASTLRRRATDWEAAQIEGRPLRVLLEGLNAVHPAMPEGVGEDVDTPEDASRYRVSAMEKPPAR